MDILLDTHLAYWYILGDERIPKMAKELIADRSNFVFVSLISAWEIGIKHAKRPDLMPMDAKEFIEGCRETGLIVLPVVEDQLLQAMEVKTPEGLDHQDPFDRFLLGAAKALKMRFMSHDAKIGAYDSPFLLFL